VADEQKSTMMTDADLDYAEAYVETLGALTELATRSTDELTPIESTPVAVPMTMVTTSTLRAPPDRGGGATR
jgi:hypothetical protein